MNLVIRIAAGLYMTQKTHLFHQICISDSNSTGLFSNPTLTKKQPLQNVFSHSSDAATQMVDNLAFHFQPDYHSLRTNFQLALIYPVALREPPERQ